MASATDDDDFPEYNPHPYRGGYDIALTYGDPLPPSSAICYPISTSPVSPPSPPPSPPRPSYLGGFLDPHPAEPFPSPDLFRSWPFTDWDNRQAYAVPEGGDGWNGWRRALDYLFGHAEGYGERRIGVDSYGIPIYANKKLHGAESVLVEVPPAPVDRVEYHDTRPEDHHHWSSCYSGTAEKHGYGHPVLAYDRHYAEKALHVEIDPNESVWHQKVNYHEGYQVQSHHHSQFNDSDYVGAFFGSPSIAYNRHHYEQPLHLQVEPIETDWYQKSSYSEAYQESAFPKSEWSSSHNDTQREAGDFFHSSGSTYQRYSWEQPDYVELRPYEPSWSYNQGHYDGNEEETPKWNWQYSSVGGQGENFTNSEDTYYYTQQEYYEQAEPIQVEPYKSSWSQYSSYYEAQNEQLSQIDELEGDSPYYPFHKLFDYS
ncbi:uncharacterized protein At5g39570-like isoform X1 [Zingiber officinale]|uniref:Uncharacterized protein n=1 Tax=Zingiber officinale TaxID=94328 RepID=A0A8J5KXV8_ZINOF|nr:uncharacterized protein At5g39570-like isoform X1 [Zingiber officinale]KAG6493714.1 hypothetical protein ZIOFF_048708 [Zingiber officinale]